LIKDAKVSLNVFSPRFPQARRIFSTKKSAPGWDALLNQYQMTRGAVLAIFLGQFRTRYMYFTHIGLSLQRTEVISSATLRIAWISAEQALAGDIDSRVLYETSRGSGS